MSRPAGWALIASGTSACIWLVARPSGIHYLLLPALVAAILVGWELGKPHPTPAPARRIRRPVPNPHDFQVGDHVDVDGSWMEVVAVDRADETVYLRDELSPGTHRRRWHS